VVNWDGDGGNKLQENRPAQPPQMNHLPQAPSVS
jgi:hypothetical protein